MVVDVQAWCVELAREPRDDPINAEHDKRNMTTTTTPTPLRSSTPSLSAASTERKSSATWVSSSQSRNPVAMRLYKVLSTNYEDEDTRQALRTLSDLYAAPLGKGKEPTSATGTEEDLEEADGLDASVNPSSSKGTYDLALAEAFPGEFAAKARKNLRKDMEKKLAETSKRFLEALGEVDAKLQDLQGHVAAMRESCKEAETQLSLTNESSRMLLERAGHLRDERQEVETKKAIATAFLSRFTLTPAEIEALASRDVPVGPRFFEAMDKTEKVREDCQVLMAGETATTAGLDIMASTSSYLEQGYEKILRFCAQEFRQVSRDSQLEVSSGMQESVSRLRKRPELLSEALTSLSETRQTTLLSAFLAALTRGGPSGYPRPIELHAHDPLRYVGDMLAWVHQAIAAEREFLESLFGLKSDGRMMGSVRKFDEEGEEEEWVRELMDLAVGKLCTPLKMRVQQTTRSQESSIVSYKIANLLQFYSLTMERTIGDKAVLSKTLKEITEIAYKIFYDAIQTQSQALYRIPLDHDDPSLTPPPAMLDHAQILREIMAVYQSSLLGDEDEEQLTSGFQKVLDIMIDPLVQVCISSSEEKANLRPRWDDGVYVLNCLCYVESLLSPFEFTIKKREEVQALVDQRVSALIDEHVRSCSAIQMSIPNTLNFYQSQSILRDAGLHQIAETCKYHKSDEPLARIPSTQPQQLQYALRQFSTWLSGLEVVHSPRLAQLTVQKLHSRIHQQALARLAKTYRLICEEVRKKENKYEAGETLLGGERPFGQVHLLWQIFGLVEDDYMTEEEEDSENEDEEVDEEAGSSEEEDEDSEDSESPTGSTSLSQSASQNQEEESEEDDEEDDRESAGNEEHSLDNSKK
ncbi:hypothetical protein CVT24_013413 [Panaeolus cyanescens]|uniref:Conserved oligomeric Golgi complex subunit 6 n=1 Tax=Panaeolus cyanescens TaxID=181874 RepID=A0A409WAH0_9AGAR|nr:hypothetical protein CVT24_013413 [Panaeolus cyanescens]